MSCLRSRTPPRNPVPDSPAWLRCGYHWSWRGCLSNGWPDVFSERKEKVLAQIRAMRGGKLNETAFGKRMRGDGILAAQMAKLFAVACRRAGIPERTMELL